MCHDPKRIAESFNNFFTNIASELVTSFQVLGIFLPQDQIFFRTFYHSRNPHRNTFLIKEVTEDFILKELNRFGVSKSTGLDGLPARFIKDGAEFLKTPITLLINMSFTTGTVPEEMKSARARPIFKKIIL